MKINDRVIACISEWLDGKLKEGSTDDLKARRALAKALRYGPPDRGLLFMLAGVIDPDCRDDLSFWLVFKRQPGNRSKSIDHRRVAAIIWHELRAGKRQKAAVSIAMEKCGVGSRDKALAAYNRWKPIFEKWGPKMKALTKID